MARLPNGLMLQHGRKEWPRMGGAALALALAPAQAEVLELPAPGEAVVGAAYSITTRYGETIPDLAEMHQVGFHELLWANPSIHPWMPGEGVQVRIPRQYILPGARREGLVLNLPELRLYFFEAGGGATRVRTYPISAGRIDWVTPLGATEVVDRLEHPNWYPPESVRVEHRARGEELPRVVPPGPENPLGRYALMLGMEGYFIHGTNRNEGIGMRVTHGCIRLRPADIAELVYRVPLGTPVQILSMPIKVGLLGGVVYMEAHAQPLEEFPMAEKHPELEVSELLAPLEALEAQLQPGDYVMFWDQVLDVARRQAGVPVAVGWRADFAPPPSDRPELRWRLRKPEEAG